MSRVVKIANSGYNVAELAIDNRVSSHKPTLQTWFIGGEKRLEPRKVGFAHQAHARAGVIPDQHIEFFRPTMTGPP